MLTHLTNSTIETASIPELEDFIRANGKLLVETMSEALGMTLQALSARDPFLAFLAINVMGCYCRSLGEDGVLKFMELSRALSAQESYRTALLTLTNAAGDVAPREFYANRDFPGKEDAL